MSGMEWLIDWPAVLRAVLAFFAGIGDFWSDIASELSSLGASLLGWFSSEGGLPVLLGGLILVAAVVMKVCVAFIVALERA